MSTTATIHRAAGFVLGTVTTTGCTALVLNLQQSQANSTALLTTLLMLKASSSPGSIVGGVMRTRRLHARLAYVMRVENRARVKYAAATPAVRKVSCCPRPRGKKR